jgi:hypothetical protein
LAYIIGMQIGNAERKLLTLAEIADITYVKAGLEFERNSLCELDALRVLARIIGKPLAVKIGGPDARTDIDLCADRGASVVIAPMVETAYALKVAAEAAALRSVAFGINLETVTAWQNLRAMMESTLWARVQFVTIGRSDLAASMGYDNDDAEVESVVRDIVATIAATDPALPVAVGGRITVDNAASVAAISSRVSTRQVCFETTPADAPAAVAAALHFEAEFYSAASGYSREAGVAQRLADLANQCRKRATCQP